MVCADRPPSGSRSHAQGSRERSRHQPGRPVLGHGERRFHGEALGYADPGCRGAGEVGRLGPGAHRPGVGRERQYSRPARRRVESPPGSLHAAAESGWLRQPCGNTGRAAGGKRRPSGRASLAAGRERRPSGPAGREPGQISGHLPRQEGRSRPRVAGRRRPASCPYGKHHPFGGHDTGWGKVRLAGLSR